MRLRRVPPKVVVEPRISAVKAGLDLNTDELEAHYLAGGNVANVVNALISADKAGIELSFQRAAAIDLAGRDVLEAVKMSVNPKVIKTPLVAAVAKDGIQVKALSRVTVRANIDRLVGGAGEETILARVGEGIVTTIGSAVDHKQVLENPDMISRTVLEKGLDSGTAFEILSIDIADVDVRREHRRQTPDRPGRGRQAGRPGQGRGSPRHGRRPGAGDERPQPGDARQAHRGRGPGPHGHGRSLPLGQPRHHGLLPDEERRGRHRHAGVDLQADRRGPARRENSMEDLIPVLGLIAWMIISALSGSKKKRQQQGESDGEPSQFQQALEELMREATGQAQQQAPPPPPPPPPPTPMRQRAPAAARMPVQARSEHVRTASEHVRTASEHARTASEHARTISEHTRTASENVWATSEHSVTASEHLPGDAAMDRPPISESATVQRPQATAFGAGVLAGLRHPGSLKQAIVLREILGAPVSLRQSDER